MLVKLVSWNVLFISQMVNKEYRSWSRFRWRAHRLICCNTVTVSDIVYQAIFCDLLYVLKFETPWMTEKPSKSKLLTLNCRFKALKSHIDLSINFTDLKHHFFLTFCRGKTVIFQKKILKFILLQLVYDTFTKLLNFGQNSRLKWLYGALQHCVIVSKLHGLVL